MKKIFNICLLSVAAAGFIACSDNDDAGSGYLRENSVQVVSSKLFFNADAQKGGVKFNAPAGSTASVSETWAKAEVKDDSVVVSVTNNTASDSRAAVLTIKNGNDSTNLSILQSGAVFKYTGEQNIVVNDNDTALALPYTKVGAEPSISLGVGPGTAAVASTEDKGNAFVAHINANTTGEPRTFDLVITNQEKHDTVTVTQGSLNDFIDKTYYLQGYDLLKLTPQTQSLDELLTRMTGTIRKEADGSVSFAVSGSPMVVHLGFDPKTLAFSLKGGDLLSTTPRGSASLLRVTSVWDKSFYIALQKAISQVESQHNAGKISDADYDQFNQSTLPGIYSIFASKNLSMTAAMMASEEDGVVMGLFEDSGTNATYMNQQTGLAQMGFSVNSFDANTLGIYEYLLSGKKLTFRRPMVMLMVPVFYHPLPSAGGAKPSLPHQQKAGISLPALKALLR
ncbi:BACON domain-containing protein [Prevotella denticola]|uniref:BACON domain-containing protein n=1 Tax=Prevotella denticola TaxID=28129 RepID=UPI00242C9199|nr:BACON domain-containing carbohydrate-binding protein [Prevotella denticola]